MAIAEEIYSGAAEYGKFRAFLSVIIGGIITIILFIIGFPLIFKKYEPLEQIVGNIIIDEKYPINCQQDKNSKYLDCLVYIKYKLPNKDEQIQQFSLLSQQKTPINNQQITLYYKKEDENTISLYDKINTRIIGFIMIIIGLVILGSSIFWLYVVNKYKFAASTTGVADAYSIIKNI